MDEGTRTGGQAVEQPRSPEEIRDDIAQTREELGETVEALAGKADVKGQAKAKVDSVKERVGAAKEAASERAPDSAREGAHQIKGTATAHPMPLAVLGAFIAGVLVGRIMGRR